MVPPRSPVSLPELQILHHKASRNEGGKDGSFLRTAGMREAAGNGGGEKRKGRKKEGTVCGDYVFFLQRIHFSRVGMGIV